MKDEEVAILFRLADGYNTLNVCQNVWVLLRNNKNDLNYR